MTNKPRQSNTYAVVVIGILFFIFGFVTWLNGTLIPFLKLACELKNDVQAFFVTFAFFMAYFFLALPSARILKITGYKKGMAWGLFIMAIGSLIFIPAAYDRNFGLFLTGLFIQGAGLALLQTASNPYIIIIGPAESAAKRISIMGVCNKTAGMLGPLILSAIVLKNANSLKIKISATTEITAKETLLSELAQRVIAPYSIMALVLAILAILIYKSALPEINTDQAPATSENSENKSGVLQFPHLLLGVVCIFLYKGTEVMAGDGIVLYGESIGMPLDQTKYFTTFTLSGMLIGYLVGIFTIPKIISQQTALRISAILGCILSLCAFFTHGSTAIMFIALLGLANALMWPSIFPLALNGLGRFIRIGSAMLIMGIAGGAVIPLLYGYLKDKAGLPNNLSFLVCILPAYLYIFYYSTWGYKAGKGRKTSNLFVTSVNGKNE